MLIIGDTSDYYYDKEIDDYRYVSGEKYYSPVSLKIEVILSQEQAEIGLDTEYMGYYEYVESFRSAQGYQVNLLQDTMAAEAADLPKNFQSEKIAVFVADGVRYTLTGRVSAETMRQIVDSMTY